jgi:hypothetical protein
MTIGLRQAAAWAEGSTSVSPALPTGSATGDRMFLFVGCKPYTATINTPSGWTEIAACTGANGTTNPGNDSGSVQWKLFYRDWVTGDAAPTVSITSGNSSLAQIKGFTKAVGKFWDISGAKGSDTTSGTGFSLTADVDPGITSGDWVASWAVIAGNNATFGTPVCTATSATLAASTESPATEGTTATGFDLEASASHTNCTAGTNSAAPVWGWTLSVAQTGGGAIVRLREINALAGTGEITTSGLLPTVGRGTVIGVPVGAITVVGQAPSAVVMVHTAIPVVVGAITTTGLAPSALVQTIVSPGAGAMTITGPPPVALLPSQANIYWLNVDASATVDPSVSIEVPAGAVSLSGLAPTVSVGASVSISVPAGSIAVTGLAPTRSVSGETNTAIDIDSGSVVLSGQASTLIRGTVIPQPLTIEVSDNFNRADGS